MKASALIQINGMMTEVLKKEDVQHMCSAIRNKKPR